jgi:hypothetical protein
MWTTVPYESIGEAKPDLSFIGHVPKNFKSPKLPWPYCRHCGLVRLRNRASELAWKWGCNWKDIEKVRTG